MTKTLDKTFVRDVNIDTWALNAANAERDFFWAMVNGLEQFQQGNHQKLAKSLTIANGKTSRRIKRKDTGTSMFALHMKRIILACVDGLSIEKFDADSDWGYKFSVGPNGGVNSERLEGLRMLAAQGARVRGKGSDLYRKSFLFDQTPKADQSEDQRAVAYVKNRKRETVLAEIKRHREKANALEAALKKLNK